MKEPTASKPVERLFPFVLRPRNLLAGRDTLLRSKGKLHFDPITTDILENSRTKTGQTGGSNLLPVPAAKTSAPASMSARQPDGSP